MGTLDEEIGKHLEEAMVSGELRCCEHFGRPLPDDTAWDATPAAFRMPFKVLKNAGYKPPEIELFHRRSRLAAQAAATLDAGQRQRVLAELGALEQAIALRLEGLRLSERI